VILRRLKIDGFGALVGEWRFEPARLHVVCGQNERGKTTLAAAITAALYGLDADKRSWRDRATPLEQHRPWSGRPYALELEFELGDRRYVVNRHFGNNRLTVLTDGRDTTEEFRHGSGEYKLGEELLGMSADQFARSALWLQPGPGRLGGPDVRPDGSLTTLLESMASSVSGDATAAQAVGVLELALRHYEGVQQSGMIANEIKKLDIALGTIAVDLGAAQAERDALANDLAQLAELEEKARTGGARLAAARTEGARRRLLELDDRLARDEAERAQVHAWREEALLLAPARDVPDDASDRLQSAQAEIAAGRRTLEEVRDERQRDIAAPRLEVETTLATYANFAGAQASHIEELHTLEKDLERARQQLRAAVDKRAELEKELAGRGVPIARASELSGRFGELSTEDRGLLTQYPAQTQHLVTESETSQRAAQGGTALIDEIGKQRNRRRTLGFVIGATGLAAGGASVWLALIARSMESFIGLAVTLVGVAMAVLLLLRSASHRNTDRTEALKQVVDAQRKLGEIRQRRKEREDLLHGIAERIGFPDVTSLLREFGEYQRLTAEVQRLDWLDEDRKRAAAAVSGVEGEVRQRLARVGLDASLAPHEAFARLRDGIGSVLEAVAARARLDELENGLLAREKAAQKRVADARAEIRGLARTLDLPLPGAGDDDDEADADDDARRRVALEAVAAAIARRTGERRRLDTLEHELLPKAAARVLADDERAALAAERDRVAAEVAAAGGTAAGAAIRGSADGAALERELEATRRAIIDLHARVGGRDIQSAKKLGELMAEREVMTAALRRARAFKQSVELARDRFQAVARETHAKWSEHLGGRVDELLGRFGMAHAGFRLSDKLEPSLALAGERLTGARLEQALSTGAREQVALALRIAICEFLARGGAKLPLLFDDPLAHADDARAQGLLDVLAEAARTGHQVIVLTCHRATIDALRAADPAAFDARTSLLDFDRAGAARPAESGPLAH
jgi:DNA repair exonuclease SbcCD ATPase subunit